MFVIGEYWWRKEGSFSRLYNEEEDAELDRRKSTLYGDKDYDKLPEFTWEDVNERVQRGVSSLYYYYYAYFNIVNFFNKINCRHFWLYVMDLLSILENGLVFILVERKSLRKLLELISLMVFKFMLQILYV